MDYMDSLDILAKTVEQKTISSVLSQLNSLVEKGILTVKTGEGKFFKKQDDAKIHYENIVELSFDSSEYIKNLETANDKLIGENKYLRDLFNNIQNIKLG